VFLRVKGSEKDYLEPKDKRDSEPGWWFAESDTYHFDHWLSFGLPYLLVLVDVKNQGTEVPRIRLLIGCGRVTREGDEVGANVLAELHRWRPADVGEDDRGLELALRSRLRGRVHPG